MSSPTITFSLRLPVEAYAQLRDRAATLGVSMNALAVEGIEQRLNRPDTEPLTREMWVADFSALEERVLSALAGDKPGLENIYELRIDGTVSESDLEKLKAHFAKRLTLSDTLRAQGCMYAGGLVGSASGGYVPPGERFRMGEGPIFSGTGRYRKDEPEIQHLAQPGAFDWDAPLSGQAGAGVTWTENTGSMPVPPDTLVEYRLRKWPDAPLIPKRAAELDWTLEDDQEDADIIEWRLASIELQPKVDGGVR